jgi:hypothetical protein
MVPKKIRDLYPVPVYDPEASLDYFTVKAI